MSHEYEWRSEGFRASHWIDEDGEWCTEYGDTPEPERRQSDIAYVEWLAEQVDMGLTLLGVSDNKIADLKAEVDRLREEVAEARDKVNQMARDLVPPLEMRDARIAALEAELAQAREATIEDVLVVALPNAINRHLPASGERAELLESVMDAVSHEVNNLESSR